MRLIRKKQSNTPRRRSIRNDDNTSNTTQHIFKRNRTLTGTTSNRLNTTNSNADLKSTRTHVHNLSILRRKIWIVLVVILISAIPIWLLISNFTANVSINIINTGMIKTVNEQSYQNVIQKYLDDNPISRLTFFLNESNLSSYATSKLPEVENVKQGNMTGIGGTSFAINLRVPVAGWRMEQKQYYVDSKGIPFQANYFAQPSVQIVDNSGISYKIGTTAIASNRFLSFVGQIVALTKNNGFTVTQAILPPNTTRELIIKLNEVSYYVKLSIDRPAGEQVEDMAVAIRYFQKSGQTPRYIDVRVSGKAFYK